MVPHAVPDKNGGLFRAAEEDVDQLQEALSEALHAAGAAVRDTSRLTRLFTSLSEPAPLELMLDRVLSTLSELFASDIVVLLDPAGTGSFSPLAAVGLPEDMLHLPMAGGDAGSAATVMATRTPLLKTDVGADPSEEPQLRELAVKTSVWVPVTDSHASRGVLMLARCRPAPFLQADVDLLTAMAYRIGLALEQAQYSAQLVQIVQTGREIGRHLDESEICREAVRMLPTVLWVDASALVLTAQDGALRCVALGGLDSVWNPTWERLTDHLLGTSSLGRVQPFSTPDLGDSSEWLSLDQPGNCPVRALLAIPIQREEHVLGLLYALRFSSLPFTPDTIQMALLYAGQISAAMENARLYRLMSDELAERRRAEQMVRESEERFKLALEGGDLGLWDWNVVSGESLFNERWAEMLGYSLSELKPHIRAWEELIHPDDLPSTMATLNAHLEGRTPYFEAEHRLLSRSGSWVWVLNKGKVTHRDGEGHPLRVVGTNLDITEAKQIGTERLLIEQHQQQLWRAESLSRMAGGIAHHFNNQLMVVMGNLDLAIMDLPQGTKARSRLNRALTATDRAADITRLMLAYLGQTKAEKGALDLVATVGEALPMWRASLPENVHLRADFNTRGPIILADGVQIKQILTNLVANATEAIGGEEGEITLAIGFATRDDVRACKLFPLDWKPQAETYAFIAVSDNGCGLDETRLENIFDPFFSTKFTGRGLGLPVALGLVRTHEGAIAVESELGRGATFRLIFPLSAHEVPPSREEEAAASEPSAESGLVLVVDDEPAIRAVTRAQLEELGYEAEEACDGFEAVATFRARPDAFRLVILDLSMPGMNGWETLAALRAMSPAIPVILASGHDEAQVMGGDHREQSQAFLHKPYRLDELKTALNKARRAIPATSI